MTIKGTKVSTLQLHLPADGKFYGVQAIRFDGEAGDEPEIPRALASFRFLKAPSVPMGPSQSGSAAYRAGEFAGRAFIAVLAVALIIFVAMRVIKAGTRGKMKREAATPPPLPPKP